MGSDGSQAGTLTSAENEPGRALYSRREPAALALLLVIAVVSFVGVTALSRTYHAQQRALGDRWFARGLVDMKAHRFDRAVSEFRTALLYSRDDYTYQLNLAEALIGLKRTDEAYAYLVNLWEREPDNGRVNLELARIAAERSQTEQALRYYHNAIYTIWPDDQEAERRDARLELIEYLLRINAKAQAQSELIAMAANLGDDPRQHARAGNLFLQAQDYEHALAEYHLTLKSERQDPNALAGAGWAAFELGRYALAEHYLQAAVSADPSDTQSASRLKISELVLHLDPFQRQISASDRDRVVIEAFTVAGERVKACATPANDKATADGGISDLSSSWENMKPRITERGLHRDPDLVEQAMNLVFGIERQTSNNCAAPTDADRALLLIAKLHEGT